MDKLKLKVIDEYNKYVKRLNIGHQDCYLNILNMMCFIELHSYFDNEHAIYEHLINM